MKRGVGARLTLLLSSFSIQNNIAEAVQVFVAGYAPVMLTDH